MLTSDFQKVAQFVADAVECPISDRGAAAIGWERDGDVVAGVMYDHWTGASVTASIAVAPGAVMTKDFLWAIFNYPFNQLKVGIIIAFISEANWKSRNLVERMGFGLETRVVGAYPDGDMLIYTMTAGNCRWLEKDNGQEVEDADTATD